VSDGDLPLLVFAGVDKAGSTTLAMAVRHHPDLAWVAWHRGGIVPRRPLTRADGVSVGDASGLLVRDNRLFADPGAPSGIAALTHPTIVVVSLREPIARVVSLYRHRRALGRFPTDLTLDHFVAMQLEAVAPPGNDFRVVEEGRYVASLERWLAATAGQNGVAVRPVFFEEWRTDPVDLCRSLIEAVGLAPGRLPARPEALNASGDARYPRLSRGLHLANRKLERGAARIGRRDELRRWLWPARQRFYVRTLRHDRPAPTLSPSLRAALEEYYGESNRRLATCLGRTLPWAESPAGAPNGPH
jgi:hypothetical protein